MTFSLPDTPPERPSPNTRPAILIALCKGIAARNERLLRLSKGSMHASVRDIEANIVSLFEQSPTISLSDIRAISALSIWPILERLLKHDSHARKMEIEKLTEQPDDAIMNVVLTHMGYRRDIRISEGRILSDTSSVKQISPEGINEYLRDTFTLAGKK